MSLEKLTPCATLDAATRARLVEQPPVGGRVNLLGICVTGASGNLVEQATGVSRRGQRGPLNCTGAPLRAFQGLDLIDRELQKVYAEQGLPERWTLLRYDCDHQETAEGRREIVAFLQRLL